VVDSVTGLGQGRWRRIKGLDRGREQRRGDSREESMMVPRLRGGLDDDASSMEIFSWKFWQPSGVSESLWGLGFV
jgi:hypothetical protein